MIPAIHQRSAIALLTLSLFLAGCGAGQFNTTSGAFTIAASTSATTSNGQVQFTAMLPTGDDAAVVWSVAGGDNASSLGEGHIDATGLYTPPSALSQDTIRVQIAATMKANPSQTATTTVSVTPGFVQSLLPENAALTNGASIEASAEIAEVNAGSVHWTLTTAANGSTSANGEDMGTLSDPTCQHSLDQYTICKVTYTASSSPSGSTVYLKAAIDGFATTSQLTILLNDGVDSSPLINQAAQTGAADLGTSGGNDNDYDTYQDATGASYVADCCGGTLGALVEDSKKNQYILSNNHVLAESDQGKPGDTIDQPGLVDDGCVPLSHAGSMLRAVGFLKYSVPLATSQTNVDAALASAVPGAIDPDGSILQFAPPSSSGASDVLGPAPPVAGTGEVLNANNLNGLKLAKSGRTTGLTCSTVEAVDFSVKVDYFKDCAETQPYYTKTFTNQIGIAGDGFSDSGDSGALVVDAANAEPVGLFFSGGTDSAGNGLSIASPIGQVLQELGEQAGSSMRVVGTTTPHQVACVRYNTNLTTNTVGVSSSQKLRAQSATDAARASLINPAAGILGVNSGKSLDSPGEGAVIVYVDRGKSSVTVPQTVNGVRTLVIATDAAAVAREAVPAMPMMVPGIALSANVLANAEAVVAKQAKTLMQDPSIFGVGVTQSLDDPQEPALLVLVDPEITPQATPATIDGLRVRYMKLHRFHVTRSKYATPNAAPSCSLKKIAGAGTSGRDVFRP